MIGLDALDHRWLRRWMESGRLPNLASFAKSSLQLEVRSDGELLHGSVWPTFASGVGPGHHGRYWWMQWLAEEGRYERESHPALHFDPFWRQLSLAGRRSIVVDVPYVPPVRDGHTWTATGWGLHDEVEPASVPEGFLPAIRRRYGDHPLRMDTMHSMDPGEKRQMASRMAKGVAIRCQLLADFAARRDWDLLVLTFAEFHKAGHYLAAAETLTRGLTSDEALQSAIEPLDRALPEIVERAGPDADVCIFALHGMDARIEFAQVARQFAALVDGRDLEAAAPPPDLVRRLRNAMPKQVQQGLWYLLPPGVRQRRYARTVARGLEGGERLFHVAHDTAPALRVNLAGRERGGAVSEAEREALLSRADEIARSLVTPEGTPAFHPLLRVQELHPGPRAHRLPDAMVPPNPAVFRTDALIAPGGEVLRSSEPEARNGVHAGTGFCLYRAGAAAAALRESIDARDFAPTILARLGLPPQESFEGSAFLG